MTYRIVNCRWQSGERYRMLVDAQTGMPAYWPTLFVTTQLRNAGRSPAQLDRIVSKRRAPTAAGCTCYAGKSVVVPSAGRTDRQHHAHGDSRIHSGPESRGSLSGENHAEPTFTCPQV